MIEVSKRTIILVVVGILMVLSIISAARLNEAYDFNVGRSLQYVDQATTASDKRSRIELYYVAAAKFVPEAAVEEQTLTIAKLIMHLDDVASMDPASPEYQSASALAFGQQFKGMLDDIDQAFKNAWLLDHPGGWVTLLNAKYVWTVLLACSLFVLVFVRIR